MNLPNRIFFTGVPGSRWSGIAQVLESIPGFNTSDRSDARTYNHGGFTGHVGAYFGPGMEFDADLDPSYLDQAWTEPGGTRLVKSHDWPYHFTDIEFQYPDAWIMLVYRPDMSSYAWWHEAGGFNIKYPCYDAYRDGAGMLAEIVKQNDLILKYGATRGATWSYFTPNWIQENFGHRVEANKNWSDILVTVIK